MVDLWAMSVVPCWIWWVEGALRRLPIWSLELDVNAEMARSREPRGASSQGGCKRATVVRQTEIWESPDLTCFS